MSPRGNDHVLVPQARNQLDQFKYEVASDLSYIPPDRANRTENYRRALDDLKYRVARELGIPLQPGYNGELRTRDAGAIGGRMGGPIGGHMVKRMIALAEEELVRRQGR